jgi:hypothetical protein
MLPEELLLQLSLYQLVAAFKVTFQYSLGQNT